MDVNLGQKKIYYNIDVQKDKLYSNLKDSFINLCKDVPLKRSVFWRLKAHDIGRTAKHGIEAGHHIQVVK